MANLPWFSDKLFALIRLDTKPNWLRITEWFIGLVVCFALGFLMEYKVMGSIANQEWEFYVVGLCLFVVFALPGFIYHTDLKKILRSPKV